MVVAKEGPVILGSRRTGSVGKDEKGAPCWYDREGIGQTSRNLMGNMGRGLHLLHRPSSQVPTSNTSVEKNPREAKL
jgi:hypothetical protein